MSDQEQTGRITTGEPHLRINTKCAHTVKEGWRPSEITVELSVRLDTRDEEVDRRLKAAHTVAAERAYAAVWNLRRWEEADRQAAAEEPAP